MRDSFADLFYEQRGLFLTLGAIAGIAAIVTAFLYLPRNEFFEAVGVTGAQDRVTALNRAMYWQSRALVHASAGDELPTVVYGYLVGFDSDGTVVASIGHEGAYKQRRFRLADVVVTNPDAVANVFETFRLSRAKFDVYQGDHVVIWIDLEPLNLRLIEYGFATPEQNPPTNIVDAAFARHYWRIVNGK